MHVCVSSERRWHQNMQKRLCRRPEIFNAESIHYRIRSLCFCCLWNVHIHHQSTQDHCPSSSDDLEWKISKAKKLQTYTNTNTDMCKHAEQCAHQRPKGQQTCTPWKILLSQVEFITPFLQQVRKCNVSCYVRRSDFLYSCQRLNQIYEPVMKHFMLIVFVYEQINGSRAKRMMMWAHTQHDKIPEEFINCLQVIRGNN